MNQDKRKFVAGIRLTAHSVRPDWMLFEINYLPDDYDDAGSMLGIALTKRQDGLKRK
jgi:hypothetical protein